MHRPPPARGLTLLETLVATGIVALLMTLALPSFGSMLARHRLRAAAEHLAMDLAEGRLQAARRGQPLYLNLQPGPDWCYALAGSAACACSPAQVCQLKAVRAGDHPGVTLLAGPALRIDPQPGASTGSALLQGSDGTQLRVALTPLGRPKVCAPGAAVPGMPGC